MKILRAMHPARFSAAAAAVTLAVMVLAVPAGQILPARAAVVGTADDPKPTIVLEHGAWADASSWDRVIRLLQGDGYTVYAPPDPLRGLSYDSAALADFLATIKGPVVLVGHSYGGMVITNAAVGDPYVKALVYDDAYIPAQGDTAAALTAAQPGSCLSSDAFTLVSSPGSPPTDPDIYLKVQASGTYPGFAQCFANGVPAGRPRCWPPPSGRLRSAPSLIPPGLRHGRRSRHGTWLAPRITSSRLPSN